MKRRFVMLAVLIAAFMLTGCGKDPYAEAIQLNRQFVGHMKTYLDDLDKADSADDVAGAMNKYADSLEKVWPKMKALAEAHPELKEKKDLPEALEATNKEAEQLGMKMGTSFRKIAPYMQNEKVQKAQARLSKVMQ